MVRHGADRGGGRGPLRRVDGDRGRCCAGSCRARDAPGPTSTAAWPRAGTLAEWARALVDLHGQHDHQSLLAPAVQRDALDRFGGVDLEPLLAARKELAGRRRATWPSSAATSGRGPGRSTCCASRSTSSTPPSSTIPTRTSVLGPQEDRAGRRRWPTRRRRWPPWRALDADDGAVGRPGRGLAALDGHRRSRLAARLRGVAAELTDLASTCGPSGEAIEDDPERLAAVQQRRRRSTSCAASTARPGRGDGLPRARRATGWPSSRTATAWPPSSTRAESRRWPQVGGSRAPRRPGPPGGRPALAAATQAHLGRAGHAQGPGRGRRWAPIPATT